MTSIAKLTAILRNDEDSGLPPSARAALLEMADQIEKLTDRVNALDTKIVAAVKADEAARPGQSGELPGDNGVNC